MSSPPKFSVAVCGGGIGGLICALALCRRSDIAVCVYEGASSFSEVGVGIGIWPRAWKIIEKLGLAEALLETTHIRPSEHEVPIFTYRKSDAYSGFNISTMYAQGGLMPFRRPDFQNVLLQHLPSSCRTYLRKRLKSYSRTDSGSIELVFEDGTKATCDVLCGADGIRSSVRRNLLLREAQNARQRGEPAHANELESSVDPVWSGVVAYRAAIPSEVLADKNPNHRIFTQPTQYLGRNAHIIAYPMAQGRLINFAAFKAQYGLEFTAFEEPLSSACVKDEFANIFDEWEPEVRALVDCVGDPLKWAIHVVKPLQSFISSSDAVVLVGDAAHAMEPFQGNGAGQAIEDAYILAEVLGHAGTTKDTLLQSLRIYDGVRRPFANNAARLAHLAGRSFALLSDDHSSELEDKATLRAHIETIRKRWEYCWNSSLEIDTDLKIVS